MRGTKQEIPSSLYLRGRVWWYRPRMIDGVRPPRVSLNTPNLQEAIRRAARIAARDAIRRDPGRLSMQITRYLDSARIRPATRITHRNVLGAFCDFLGDPLVSAVTASAVAGWEADMLERGLAETTRLNNVARLATFCRWLEGQGQLSISPLDGRKIANPKATRIGRFATLAQRDELIAAAPNPRIALVLHLGFFAGLRLGEIAESRADWVRMWDGGGELCVTATANWLPKDAEARSIPMGSTLRAFLAAWQPCGDGYLLPGRGHGRIRYDPSGALKSLGRGLGMDWFSAHTMRRSFGTHHAMAGTPLHLVAAWMGIDLATAQRHYLGYAEGAGHAGAIDQVDGRLGKHGR